MAQNNRCFGCMEEKGEEIKCPNCGWLEGTQAASALHLPPGTVLHGKYLLGRVLGQGGFGITYLAWDLNLNLKLAVKEYFPQELASRATGHSQVSIHSGTIHNQYEYGMEKFLQEARMLARFEGHPNIVSVRDYFQANETAYLVMNYIEGVTLKDLLATHGPKLPVDQALGIMMPVMDALKELHAIDVLHRDISPDNIYINKKGQVILIDFGAARQAISEQGRSLSVIIKPGYAPEEQYRSKGVQGPWTDIYSISATTYHMITGQLPPESLDRLVEDNLVPPSKLGVEINPDQEKALLKALSVQSKDRFQSIVEFQDVLLGRKKIVEFKKSEYEKNNTQSIAHETDSFKSDENDKQKQKSTIAEPEITEPQVVISKEKQPIKPSDSDDEVEKSRDTGSSVLKKIRLYFLSFKKRLLLTIGKSPRLQKLASNKPVFIGTLSIVVFIPVAVTVFLALNYLGSAVSGLESHVGNSPGNIINGGYVAPQNGTVFISNISSERQLYKSNIGSAKLDLLLEEKARFINVVDNWIYFRNDSDGGRIYKVRADGSNRNRLNDHDSWYVNVIGEWVYYSNLDANGSIYKVRTDGSEETLVIEEKARFLNVSDDWLYFSNPNDGWSIHRVNINGDNHESINTDDSRFLNVVDEWLYYREQSAEGHIYKMNLNDKRTVKLNEDDSWFINVHGEWIYYSNADNDGYLYKIDIEGNNRTRLNEEDTWAIHIIGDWLYYLSRESLGKFSLLEVDGNKQTILR